MCELKCIVHIAGKGLISSIIFIQSTPRLFKIETKDPIAVDKVISDIVNGATTQKVAEWPESYGEVLLEKAVLYYSSHKKKFKMSGGATQGDIAHGDTAQRGATQDDTIEYSPGFNISATIRLFGYVFGVDASLPRDGSGIQIDGSCGDEIELGFAQLTCPDAVPTGFNLLLQHEGKDYTGTASYTGERIQILGHSLTPSVTVKYVNGSWSIGGLKAMQTMVSKIFSIAEALEKGSKKQKPNKPKCKDLIGLVFDQLLQTTFDYSVGFEGFDSKEKTVKLRVTGTFQIELNVPLVETKPPIAKLDIPTILPVPLSDFTFEALVVRLGKAMIASIADIGEAILDHPDQATILIGWMSAKDWLLELINALLCRAIKPPSVIFRAWQLRPTNDPGPDSPWQKLKKVLDIVLDIGLTLFICVAVPELAGAFLAFRRFMTMARPLRVMLRHITKAIRINKAGVGVTAATVLAEGITMGDFMKEEEKFDASIKEAAEKLRVARQTIRQGLNLSAKPHASSVPGSGAIVVDWAHAVPKKQGKDNQVHDYLQSTDEVHTTGLYQWEVVVSPTPDRPPNTTDTPAHAYRTTSTGMAIHRKEFSGMREIYVWVRVKYRQSGLTFASAEWQTADVIKQVPRMSSPPFLALTVDPAGLECLFTLPQVGKGNFVFQLNMVTAGKPAGTPDAVAGPTVVTLAPSVETAWRVPISSIHWHRLLGDVASPHWLQGQVYAKSADDTQMLDSSVVRSRLMSVLVPPTGIVFAYSNGTLTGRWNAVGGQQAYELVFKQNEKAIWHVDVPSNQLTQKTAGTPLEGKGRVEVLLRQKPPANTATVSFFDSRTVNILDIPKPVILASDTYFDIPSNTFIISATTKPTLSRLAIAAFIVFPSHSAAPSHPTWPPIYTTNFEVMESGQASRVLLYIPTIELPHPLPSSLQISTMTSAHLQGPLSDPWTLPVSIPSTLPACTPAVSFNKEKYSLTVSWVDAPPPATRVVVEIVEHDSELKNGGGITKEAQADTLGVAFSAEEYLFVDEQRLTITCISWRGHELRGSATSVDFVVPILEVDEC